MTTLTDRRRAANERVLKILADYLRRYPDMRLGQALRNLGVVCEVVDAATGIPTAWANGFYEEPEATLARVEAISNARDA